ncbi:MAG: helix-turn-helix domain-containing protein [Clostridiales bacterium]|nr:helix-turn-helix domain-containing protein [Clostridiales bacterium]
MSKYKHFNLSQRVTIEQSLKDCLSFKSISKDINHDCTSISKEVKRHIIREKTGYYGRSFVSA